MDTLVSQNTFSEVRFEIYLICKFITLQHITLRFRKFMHCRASYLLGVLELARFCVEMQLESFENI